MRNELEIVRDLKNRVSIASALEKEGRFEEADGVWEEMRRIASENDEMVRTAAVPEGWLGKAGKWIGEEAWPVLKRLFSRPSKRFEEAVAPKMEGLNEGAKKAKMRGLLNQRQDLTPTEKWLTGNQEKGIPSYLYTHGPAAAAGAAGLAGLYGAGKVSGGREGYKHGLEKAQEGEGYAPHPFYGQNAGTYDASRSYGEGPIVGPVPGSQVSSSVIGDIESRLNQVERKVGDIEQRMMSSIKSATDSLPKGGIIG